MRLAVCTNALVLQASRQAGEQASSRTREQASQQASSTKICLRQKYAAAGKMNAEDLDNPLKKVISNLRNLISFLKLHVTAVMTPGSPTVDHAIVCSSIHDLTSLY